MTQPSPFCSTTTATGLPSTPSRNTSVQPQARRACVNPFSMWWIISNPKSQIPRSKSRRIAFEIRVFDLGFGFWDLGFGFWDLEKGLDFLLELFLRRDA